MLRNLFKDRKGFTLIEVVIVLAIAGLIFVIVFLAVSQAQATRRDTQRKTDGNRLVAGINQYASNNNGSVPTSNAFVASYVTSFNDPGGTAYTVTYGAVPTASVPAQNTFLYSINAKCNGAVMNATSTGKPREFAVTGYLERGGSFCIDNQ